MLVDSIRLIGSESTLGIDDPTPLIGWKLSSSLNGDAQTAYEIQVSTNPDYSTPLVNTGKVSSTNQQYELRVRLDSSTKYYVRIRVYDSANSVSAWKAFSFETGLFALSDWSGATWIGKPGETAAPQLRKSFTIPAKTVVSARLHASAMGYQDIQINGSQVSKPLEPAFVDYTKRMPYITYDVTSLIASGSNVIGSTIGRGFADLDTVTTWAYHLKAQARRFIGLLIVKFSDGTTFRLGTDGSWKTKSSPTTHDSIYLGEVYDARLESTWNQVGFDDSSWVFATEMNWPAAPLVAQSHTPILKLADIPPASSTNWPASGIPNRVKLEWDRLISGNIRFTLNAPAGTVVTIAHAERYNSDGTLFLTNENVTGPMQTDTYTCKGGGETWEPRFSYKGFRVVYITGINLSQLTAAVAVPTRTAVPYTGVFNSSNSLLNQMHSMFKQSSEINFHGIISDTPVYEKLPWVGDPVSTSIGMMLSFGMDSLVRKIVVDMADGVSPIGNLGVVVPNGVGFDYSDPAWTSALPIQAWRYYQATGDTGLLAYIYEKAKKYVDSWLIQGENKWTGQFGDWSSPLGNNHPSSGYDMTSTGAVVEQTRTMANIADVLGKAVQAASWRARCASIVSDLHTRLFDPATNMYRPQVAYTDQVMQTPAILALIHGVVPNELKTTVAAALEANVRVAKTGHMSTGIIGHRFLHQVLADYGYVDTAYNELIKTDYPSVGQWFALRGATTLWGTFGDIGAQRSQTHHMHGAFAQFLFEGLGGIKRTGPSSVVIKPLVPSGDVLHNVTCTVETANGPVTLVRTGNNVDVTVAPGVTATYNGTPVPSGTSTITL